jgi:hypothetical protein
MGKSVQRGARAALSAVVIVAASVAATARVEAPPDLVLYAADATAVHGTWGVADDGTAAGGKQLVHPDAGVPKPANASASPRDYFELTFEADAGRAYRLWIRGKADRDAYSNDSVFVQFSGSVTAQGAPVYRIGTTSATSVVIENCSGCGVRGWGWQDNEYGGVAPGASIYFAQPGPQTIRIQGREDGISIDQIVLSSATYFTTPPGAHRDDATILEKTDFSNPGPGPQGMTAFTSTSYAGPAEVAAIRDINGDSRPDAIGIANSPVTISTAINAGGRSLTALQSEELWDGPESVRSLDVADFTGDGRPDLLFLDASFNRLSMMTGDGAGRFAPARGTTFATRVADFAVADFNRDGLLDVVASEPDRNTVAVHTGRGDGTFTLFSRVSSGLAPTQLATGDFNGDGKADAASLNFGQQNVYFSLGDGTGRFDRQASVATGPAPRALAVRDLNRDGFADILVSNGDGTVSVHVATTDGSFQPKRDFVATRIASARAIERGLAAADVNGDHHPDLLINQFRGGAGEVFQVHLSVLYGVGDGSFSEPDEFDVRGSGRVSVADLDADGRADVLAPSGNQGFQVLWNDPAAVNRAPVAQAGPDATVPYSQQAGFRLSGGSSSDPDGHALAYEWRDGSGAAFSGAVAPAPFAAIRQPGSYTFTLTVDDLHGGRASDSVTVVIKDDRSPSANRAPVAVAMASLEGQWPYELQFQDMPDPQTYLFSNSSDPDADALTFEWRNAAGQIVSTSESFYPSPELVPGTHQFTLTVRDGRGGQSQAAASVNVRPFQEIYITTGYKESIVGSSWGPIEDDASAGHYLGDRNAGAPKAGAPLESPASYAEFTFPADPTQEYKLWVRLRAGSNHWANDSIWVQFTGSADAAGNPVFRTGSTSGLSVNLEECSNCGLSGWGWRDDAWGARGITSSRLLRFPEGGLQTLRIQTREDGVAIDQIVLSSSKYRTTRPGVVKDDTTRLTFTAFWGH